MICSSYGSEVKKRVTVISMGKHCSINLFDVELQWLENGSGCSELFIWSG